MGNSNLAPNQIGVETTAGTAVTATVQLPGSIVMNYEPERVLREEFRNSMGGSNTYDDLSKKSTGQYTGRCTTNTAVYWMSAGIRGDPVISTPSGGTLSRQWLFTPVLATVPALKYLTAYWGDNTQALRAPGVFVRRIVIQADDTGPWTITVDLTGRTPETATFASLTTQSNETAKNLLSKVYFEDTGAAIDAGPTAKAATFYGFTFTHDTGVTPDYTMDGTTDMSDVQRDAPQTTLQLRAKWNANAVAEHAKWLALTRRFVRVENTGSIIEGSIAHRIRLDAAYELTGFNSKTDARNGTTRSTIDLTAVEDVTWGMKMRIAIINALTAL